MIIRFERVTIEKPRIEFNSRRRNGAPLGKGSVKLTSRFKSSPTLRTSNGWQRAASTR